MFVAVLKWGAAYFALVFGAGFFLGALRVLLVEPIIGVRYAQLIEMPIMLMVIYLAAKYISNKGHSATGKIHCLCIGCLALLLMLSVELTLVLKLQNQSIQEYLDSRDTVAFAAYIFALLLFALMPLILRYMSNRKLKHNATRNHP